MKPKVLKSVEILDCGLFHVNRAHIEEKGSNYERNIITHNGSAVIIPVFADKTVALVRQYRHAAGEYLLELPAGSLEKGEAPIEGARREVEEEIGFRANRLELLTEFYVSPGFLAEKMFVFIATELTEVGQNLDDDEFIEIERKTFPEMYEMIRLGQFADAKTMLGLIMAGTKFGFIYQMP